MSSATIKSIIYSGTILVFLLPLLRWGSGLNWQFGDLTFLTIFPLLGLIAFAQMWWHYAVAVIKRRYPDAFNYRHWYKVTSNVVLVLILLHPILLFVYVVGQDITVIDFVGESNSKYIGSAIIALVIFLLYEVADRMQSSLFWQRNFETVKVLSIMAMLLIFSHSLNLGQHLQTGWLRVMWQFMLVAFILFVIDSYTYKKFK